MLVCLVFPKLGQCKLLTVANNDSLLIIMIAYSSELLEGALGNMVVQEAHGDPNFFLLILLFLFTNTFFLGPFYQSLEPPLISNNFI
jgi:hypothetical protein